MTGKEKQHNVFVQLQKAFRRLFGKFDPKFELALQTRKTNNGVIIGDYEIIVRPAHAHIKDMYDICDLKNDKIIYKNIGLFDSAKKIIEILYTTKNQNTIEKITELDKTYLGYLLEIDLYNVQMKRVNENDNAMRYDILVAKISNKKSLIHNIRSEIDNIS